MIKSGFLIAQLILATAASATVNLGVFIGNHRGLPGEPNLLYAGKDAQDVRGALSALGGLEAAASPLLIDQPPAAVMAELDSIRIRIAALRARGETVQLIVYYSGHGGRSGFHMEGRELAMTAIRDVFQRTDANVKILVADACYSGAMLQAKGGRQVAPLEVHYSDAPGTEGSAWIASSSAVEVSNESKEFKGSLFTAYFLRAINGEGDFDKDGSVTLWEAYAFAKANLRNKVFGAAGFRQTPYFSEEVKGPDPIVLTRVSRGDAKAWQQPARMRLAEKGGEGAAAGPAGGSLAFRLDPYFPERDEPSFNIRALLHFPGGPWEWHAGAGWLQPVDMPVRSFGIERGFLVTGGAERRWRLGANTGVFAGADLELWWARSVSKLETINIPIIDFRSWGALPAGVATAGLDVAIGDRLRVPLMLQAGYGWNPAGASEAVPNMGVSLGLRYLAGP